MNSKHALIAILAIVLGAITTPQIAFADESEIEIEIENSKAKVEIKFEGDEYEFTVGTTDIDEILAIIEVRTGISQEDIRQIMKLEIEREFESEDVESEDVESEDVESEDVESEDVDKANVSKSVKQENYDTVNDSSVNEQNTRKDVPVSRESIKQTQNLHLEQILTENRKLHAQNEQLRQEIVLLREQVQNMQNVVIEQIKVIMDTLAMLRS